MLKLIRAGRMVYLLEGRAAGCLPRIRCEDCPAEGKDELCTQCVVKGICPKIVALEAQRFCSGFGPKPLRRI